MPEMTMVQALNLALIEAMRENPNVLVNHPTTANKCASSNDGIEIRGSDREHVRGPRERQALDRRNPARPGHALLAYRVLVVIAGRPKR